MGTMATTLAHELNQPLTAVSNYAAAARMDMAGPIDVVDLAENLQGIERSALYAGAIVSRLRAMVRGEAGQAECFDLNEAVRECVTLLRVASCEGVRIDCETEGEMIIVGDRVQIQQVVINLAKNGCEAAGARPGGHVKVATSVDGDRALVTVANSGPSVEPAVASDLFNWSASAKPDGMGLGLAISQTIVGAHDGEIWYAGREVDQTRFRFSVPLHCA
jgi:two-component system sensor kinase FixL